MKTHGKAKPKSAQPARRTCPGVILRVPGVPVARIRAKHSQLGGEPCKTNPISGRPEESVGQASPSTWAHLRQTNPIQPGQLADRVHGRGKDAKQTQFGWLVPAREANVQNKPNMAPNSSRNRVQWRQTNPIPTWGARIGGTKRAKQTQFPPAQRNRWGKPHPTRGCNGAKQTQFSPAGGPALRRRGCETKPISAWGGTGGSGSGRRIPAPYRGVGPAKFCCQYPTRSIPCGNDNEGQRWARIAAQRSRWHAVAWGCPTCKESRYEGTWIGSPTCGFFRPGRRLCDHCSSRPRHDHRRRRDETVA